MSFLPPQILNILVFLTGFCYDIGSMKKGSTHMNSLVSIIVPVYNVERYLPECIDSIVKQTYTNIEIILVDDGSTDSSGTICDEAATLDDRIKVIHLPNAGASAARNAGILSAAGDYLCFVDSDDIMTETMAETLLLVAERDNSDMVKCGFTEFDSVSGEGRTYTFPEERIYRNAPSCSSLLDLYFEGILFKVVWNALYKTSLAKRVVFPVGYISEDNYTCGMYLLHAGTISCVSESLYRYRRNESGVSRGYKKRPFDIAVMTSMLHEDIVKSGVKNEAFLRRLRHKLSAELLHCIRWLPKKSVTLPSGLYRLMCRHLDLRRAMILRYYRVTGRFTIRT